jgi:integrase
MEVSPCAAEGPAFALHSEAWPNPRRLRKAVLQYRSEPVAPTTYNLRRTYLCAFFTWCRREGILQEDPCAGLKHRRAEGWARLIEPEGLERLLEQPDRHTFTGLRDHALLLLTLDTGIRPSEALLLKPQHLNLKSREVYVPAETAKTRDEQDFAHLPGSDLHRPRLGRHTIGET